MNASVESIDDDKSFLSKLGYQQKLYRVLNTFQNFAFGFVQVQCLGGITTLAFGYGISIGGPFVLFWSFFIGFIMSIFVAFSLAEIGSAFPAAGSVYNWTSHLVPRHLIPLCSYIVGCSNFIGNVASDALQAFAFTNYLNALIVASGGYSWTNQEIVGVAIGILFLWSLLNGFRIDKVGWVIGFAAFLQLSVIAIISISLYVSASPNFNSAAYVFTSESYTNYTGFKSQSYVIAIGLISGFGSFSGYDGSAHMSEETNQAKKSTPSGIIYTVIATGICGLYYILALLFTMPNDGLGTDDVFAGPTLAPALNLFINVCGYDLGLALGWLTMVSSFSGGFGSVTITGRITYALMRDHALPFGDYFSQVHTTFQSPIRAIMLVCIIDSLLVLLCLSTEGQTAFYSLLSITTFGFLFSYVVPISLKLYYYNNSKYEDIQNTQYPLSLGSFSQPCGVISIIWLLLVICLSFLPTYYPVTYTNMNWLVVVVFGTAFLLGINWVLLSRHLYTGPKWYQPLGMNENGNDNINGDSSARSIESSGVSVMQVNGSGNDHNMKII